MDLIEQRKEIILLEDEIKGLEEKKKQLERLRLEYYRDYFSTKRDDYSLLTDIPINPIHEMHVLFEYSYLNVDTIGKIICELMKRYDGINCISKRNVRCERWENKFDYYTVELPRLLIGKPEDIEKESHIVLYQENKEVENDNIMVIKFSDVSLKDYPTDNPTKWITSSCGDIREKSNYSPMIGYTDGLTFDHHNLEYIKELIYSLAYYQREHSKKLMTPQETVDVYKKIFKK